MQKTTPAALRTPTAETPLYAREFPGFQLDFELPEGFEDTSWHNNETPSFDKVQPDGTILRLWVDHADRGKSTLPQDEPYFRFSLARYTADQDFLGQLAFASTPQEALKMVAMYDGV
jgi:hypothetical protein